MVTPLSRRDHPDAGGLERLVEHTLAGRLDLALLIGSEELLGANGDFPELSPREFYHHARRGRGLE